jgi:hypothetical protein
MSRRISITLLFAVAIAIVALFAVTEIVAQDPFPPCPNPLGSDYNGFECNGFKVDFSDCVYIKEDNQTKCTWKVDQLGANEISHFLVTVRPDLVSSLADHACKANGVTIDCSIVVITDGSADPSTKIFGKYLGSALVKFDGGFANYTSVEATLIFNGHFGTELANFFVKSGPCELTEVPEDGTCEVDCPDSAFGSVGGVGELCEIPLPDYIARPDSGGILRYSLGNRKICFIPDENGCPQDPPYFCPEDEGCNATADPGCPIASIGDITITSASVDTCTDPNNPDTCTYNEEHRLVYCDLFDLPDICKEQLCGVSVNQFGSYLCFPPCYWIPYNL